MEEKSMNFEVEQNVGKNIGNRTKTYILKSRFQITSQSHTPKATLR